MMNNVVRIGLIGCGTVGSGVCQLIRGSAAIAAAIGRPVQVERVAVRDASRKRAALAGTSATVTTDPMEVATGPGVDIVVEVAGGTTQPRDWMIAALRAGRPVVTANKAALAFHGDEIFDAARESGQAVFFEASVAAAIPVIDVVRNALVSGSTTRLRGILNGTCNFILSKMEAEGSDYSEALRTAQELGFAEADPALDVGGGDHRAQAGDSRRTGDARVRRRSEHSD